MFCQICNRQLAPVEPIYRLQLGASTNVGRRASLCKSCLDHFGPTRLYQISPFREQNCEHCGRPVLTPSRWKQKRAICSAKCRGALETKRAKQLRAWRRSERECWHCRKKSHQNALIKTTARADECPRYCGNCPGHHRVSESPTGPADKECVGALATRVVTLTAGCRTLFAIRLAPTAFETREKTTK